MINAKKDYNCYCRSCKLKYSCFDKGHKMNEMRKANIRKKIGNDSNVKGKLKQGKMSQFMFSVGTSIL